MKTLQLKQDFYWAGILDKNLRVFDIIMYTEFGTTYNSYILKAGDETILLKPRRKNSSESTERHCLSSWISRRLIILL